MKSLFLFLLAIFTLPLFSYITVTSPNGGETFYRGESFVITWNDNISEDVRIDIYQNGSFLLTIVSSTPSDGSYIADIPNDLYGTGFTVKIYSTVLPGLHYDSSDGPFIIDIGFINLISPVGGESLNRGDMFEIEWKTSEFCENIIIELYNGTTCEDTLAASTPNDGSYTWNVPVYSYGKDYSIKVSSALFPSLFEQSTTFIIEEGYITISNPTGGQVIEIFSDNAVLWNDNIPENVIIKLIRNNSVVKSFNVPSNGILRWNFYDENLVTASNYFIRVESLIFNTVYASTPYFTIKGTPDVSGSVSGSWTEANSPYILSDSTMVLTYDTLRIDVNVKIRSLNKINSMNILGRLECKGTDDIPVQIKDTRFVINNSASADTSRIENCMFDGNEEEIIDSVYTHTGCVLRCSNFKETADRGYIITGRAEYPDSSTDVFLLKLNSSGDQDWLQLYPNGSVNDNSYSVSLTSDGGYILTGSTYLSGDIYSQMLILRTDDSGKILWERTYGGSNNEIGYSVIQTDEGGFIVCGRTSSFGSGNDDVWVLKTDAAGNEEWNKTFGGASNDCGKDIKQTADRGYIITGYTYSYGTAGDCYCIKIDKYADLEWEKFYGSSSYDAGNSVCETNDGKYIICGTYTTIPTGYKQLWLFEIDSSGTVMFTRDFGGPTDDSGVSVVQTSDGGFLAGGNFAQNIHDNDLFLVRTDSQGNAIWERTIGDENSNYLMSAIERSDGKFSALGWKGGNSWIAETDFLGGYTDYEALLIKGNSKLSFIKNKIHGMDNYGIVINNSNPAVTNNLITGNRHGIKLTGSSSQYIVNNTIADNDSTGVFLDGNSNTQFINNIIFGNGVHQVYLNDDLSDPSFYYNNIQGGIAGFGLNTGVNYNGSNTENVDINPFFAPGTYELQSISQCKDSGYPGLTEEFLGALYLPQTDMAGNPRLSGSEIDMGCYEYYQSVVTPDSPANVTISVSLGTLTINWDDMPNANSYLIYSSNDPYGTFEYLATVSESTWSMEIDTDTKKFYNVVSSSESAKSPKPEIRNIEINKTR